jgi:capsular exopolysaccharide synthesis family protein
MLSALRETWWVTVAAGVLGGLVGLGLSLVQTPLYTSSSQLFVATTESTSPSDALQGGQLSQQRVASYAQLLTGERLAGRVVEQLGLDLTPAQLSSQIEATGVTDTVLIDVAVTDSSPARAQQIANAVDSEFIAMVSQLETSAATGRSPISVTVSDPAHVPDAPSSPQTKRNVALGLVAGVLIGSATGIARRRFDTSVTSVPEARALAGAPVIGTVQRDKKLAEQHVIDRAAPNRTAEDHRRLLANLRSLDDQDLPKVLMVCSAMPAEGRTTTIINLALTVAQAGHRVTIVEADLRHPKVTRYLRAVDRKGLTDVLSGRAALEDVIQTHSENLSVIASGPLPANPGHLLASDEMRAILEKLRSKNDVVLVDAPPLLPVADATSLAAAVDGVLLSVRYGTTRKEQLREAAGALAAVGANLLGVVLNSIPPKADTASAYGYGHKYDYATERAARPAKTRSGKQHHRRPR